MKKILFAFTLLLLFVQAALADTAVPESIKNTFAAKFPQASQVVWKEQKGGLYEADFTLQHHHFAALLDNKGILLHSGELLNWFELPAHVRQSVASDFQGFNMNLMMKENGEYFTEFVHNGVNYLIVFNSSGKAITSTKE